MWLELGGIFSNLLEARIREKCLFLNIKKQMMFCKENWTVVDEWKKGMIFL